MGWGERSCKEYVGCEIATPETCNILCKEYSPDGSEPTTGKIKTVEKELDKVLNRPQRKTITLDELDGKLRAEGMNRRQRRAYIKKNFRRKKYFSGYKMKFVDEATIKVEIEIANINISEARAFIHNALRTENVLSDSTYSFKVLKVEKVKE